MGSGVQWVEGKGRGSCGGAFTMLLSVFLEGKMWQRPMYNRSVIVPQSVVAYIEQPSSFKEFYTEQD